MLVIVIVRVIGIGIGVGIGIGCGGGDRGVGEIEAERVMAHAERLVAIGPRPVDSPASAEAAAYIEGELEGMGLAVERQAVGRVELPAVRVAGRVMMPDRVREVWQDENVIVRFKGAAPGKSIVFMAHVDSVPGSPGALDNAASVGVLLELCRALAARPPARPVVVAFTAAEEIGLVGAAVLARREAADVGLAVSLDLVGAAATVMNGLGPLMGRGWIEWLHAAADDAGVHVPPPRPHRVASRLAPEMERSDHGPFVRAGVPAVHLYGRGAARIYRPYHSPWDTTRWIDRGAIDEASRFVVAIARATRPLPAAGGDPGMVIAAGTWWTVVPRWIAVAAELALGLAAVAALLGLAVRRRRGGPPAVGSIGLLWLVPAVALAWGASVVVDALLVRTQHPTPWIHAPGAGVALALAVAALVAVLVWLTPLGARRLAGRGRFAAAGAVPLLLAGAAFLAAGAHELAWAPLLAALLLAVSGLAGGWLAALAFATSLVAVLPAVTPGFVQELAFHQILAPGSSLPLYLAVVLLPHSIAGVPLLARLLPRPASPRRRAVAAAVVLAAAVAAAAILATTPRRLPCDAASFRRHGIACELMPAGD